MVFFNSVNDDEEAKRRDALTACMQVDDSGAFSYSTRVLKRKGERRSKRRALTCR
jgi:hypothetical protein